jgi:hypothetical protein
MKLDADCRWWYSGLLHHVVFWLYATFSWEHTGSIFRAEVRNVKKWIFYIGLGEGSVKWDWCDCHHPANKCSLLSTLARGAMAI